MPMNPMALWRWSWLHRWSPLSPATGLDKLDIRFFWGYSSGGANGDGSECLAKAGRIRLQCLIARKSACGLGTPAFFANNSQATATFTPKPFQPQPLKPPLPLVFLGAAGGKVFWGVVRGWVGCKGIIWQGVV